MHNATQRHFQPYSVQRREQFREMGNDRRLRPHRRHAKQHTQPHVTNSLTSARSIARSLPPLLFSSTTRSTIRTHANAAASGVCEVEQEIDSYRTQLVNVACWIFDRTTNSKRRHTTFALDAQTVLGALPADVAELALHVLRLGPGVRDRILQSRHLVLTSGIFIRSHRTLMSWSATPLQYETTVFKHLSWQMKLHTAEGRGLLYVACSIFDMASFCKSRTAPCHRNSSNSAARALEIGYEPAQLGAVVRMKERASPHYAWSLVVLTHERRSRERVFPNFCRSTTN